MLIIIAAFPDGDVQNFGNPEDLHKYMAEEGHSKANIKAQYIFDTVAGLEMTLEDVQRWISMGQKMRRGDTDTTAGGNRGGAEGGCID